MREFKLSGNANDLLYVNDEQGFKAIRLMDVTDEGESLSLELTSVTEDNKHSVLDNFLDKEIEIVIKIK